jgi:aspartyl protease family protein
MPDTGGSVAARLGKALIGCCVAAIAVTVVVDLLETGPRDARRAAAPVTAAQSSKAQSSEPRAARRTASSVPRAPALVGAPDASSVGAPDAGPDAARTVVLRADARGHFWIDGSIDGTAVRFIIDTGASGITLGPDTARAAGLRLVDADFTQQSRTANGIARTAPVTIRNLGVGPVRLRNMPAHVTERPMPGMALLGMSFLGRLAGYEVRGDKMTLRW